MLFWTNGSLKTKALARIKGNWPRFLLPALVYLGISNLLNILANLLWKGHTTILDWMNGQMLQQWEELARDAFSAYGQSFIPFGEDYVTTISTTDLVVDLVISLLSLLLTVFVYNLLEVGYDRWNMEAMGGRLPGVKSMFSVFADWEQWRNVAGIRFLTQVATVLWSILFFIPGVVYAYKVILVPYLLAENPYLTRSRAIDLSKALTAGEKARIFWLQFSFIGWYLLVNIASVVADMASTMLGTAIYGVGCLFVLAYLNATMAELYAYMREKAFRMNITDATELAGFAAEE